MESTATAHIDAELGSIDIADWLFTLTDGEYQRCAPGEHIAAGATTTDDGTPMSINVERVGDSLLVQHYIGEVVSRHHCRLVSDSDSFTAVGRTKLGVVWELTVAADGTNGCVFTNRVLVSSTDDYVSFLAEHGITVEQAIAVGQPALESHNHLETPLYAKSIERKALAAG